MRESRARWFVAVQGETRDAVVGKAAKCAFIVVRKEVGKL